MKATGRVYSAPMSAVDLLRELFQRADARGSRSTALHPLGWALLTLASATVVVGVHGGERWLVIGLFVATCTIAAVYVGAFVYLLRVDRNSLRSERFNLSRMAMERTLRGDSLGGFSQTELPAAPLLPAADQMQGEKT